MEDDGTVNMMKEPATVLAPVSATSVTGHDQNRGDDDDGHLEEEEDQKRIMAAEVAVAGIQIMEVLMVAVAVEGDKHLLLLNLHQKVHY